MTVRMTVTEKATMMTEKVTEKVTMMTMRLTEKVTMRVTENKVNKVSVPPPCYRSST